MTGQESQRACRGAGARTGRGCPVDRRDALKAHAAGSTILTGLSGLEITGRTSSASPDSAHDSALSTL